MTATRNPVAGAETWFEVEYSHHGVDDWLTLNHRYDSKQAARERKTQLSLLRVNYALEFRVVRKVITTEVVQDVE